jgi:hypothetical protein
MLLLNGHIRGKMWPDRASGEARFGAVGDGKAAGIYSKITIRQSNLHSHPIVAVEHNRQVLASSSRALDRVRVAIWAGGLGLNLGL